MDIYEKKSVKPMLIGNRSDPFDNNDYIFELKFDGARMVAFLDPRATTPILRNKRNNNILPKVPELSMIHRQVKKRCVLDGELIVMRDSRPSFRDTVRKVVTTDKVKIDLLSHQLPASFVVFDILYYGDREVTGLPLVERKSLLEKVFKKESEQFALSRFIDTNGISLHEQAVTAGLEGVVAKHKKSLYVQGKRSKDWVKFANESYRRE